MRRAIWMALAFVGTTPLVAAAQQTMSSVPQGTQPMQTQTQLPPAGTAASPTGAATLAPAPDPVGTGFFNFPGQLPTAPAQAPQNSYFFGTGGSGTSGTTYRGAPEYVPDTSTPSTATGTGMGTGGSTQGTGTSNVQGTGNVGVQGTGASNVQGTGASNVQGSGMGQVSGQSVLNDLNQRVSALEREVNALRGTGGAGVSTAQPANTSTGTATGDDGDASGILATTEFDGRVQRVTSQHIDIVDVTDGTVSRLVIDEKTQVKRGNKRMKATRLSEGTPVRATFAYMAGTGEERALSIIALPKGQSSRK